jgi:Glycerophosphoryl diester phosphodiesterase family
MWGKITAVVAAATAAFGVLMPAGPAQATTHRYPQPQWYAHRGANWPDPNTQDSRLAIAAALADPDTQGVESDLRATKDGKGIMQHDADLSVATTCTGLVQDRTLADIRASCRMKDGSIPETLREYLDQVVASGKHAYLHYRVPGMSALVAQEMVAAGAKSLVRIMVSTPSQVTAFRKVLPGYYYEIGTTAGRYVTEAKALGVRVMVVPANGKVAPASWIQPYVSAGVRVDFVTYNAAQDAQIAQWPFGRVLTRDVAASRAASGW